MTPDRARLNDPVTRQRFEALREGEFHKAFVDFVSLLAALDEAEKALRELAERARAQGVRTLFAKHVEDIAREALDRIGGAE